MIIYSARTKKLPLSSDFIQNNSNAFKLFNYDSSLMSNLGNIIIQERVASDVYYTYHTLVNFNNLLDVSISSAFKELNDYINKNYPNLSRGIYEKQGKGVNGIYNQDYHKNVLLIEVGGYENTIDEVNNSLKVISDALYNYIQENDKK